MPAAMVTRTLWRQCGLRLGRYIGIAVVPQLVTPPSLSDHVMVRFIPCAAPYGNFKFPTELELELSSRARDSDLPVKLNRACRTRAVTVTVTLIVSLPLAVRPPRAQPECQ